jgi:hypothetical protein
MKENGYTFFSTSSKVFVIFCNSTKRQHIPHTPSSSNRTKTSQTPDERLVAHLAGKLPISKWRRSFLV